MFSKRNHLSQSAERGLVCLLCVVVLSFVFVVIKQMQQQAAILAGIQEQILSQQQRSYPTSQSSSNVAYSDIKKRNIQRSGSSQKVSRQEDETSLSSSDILSQNPETPVVSSSVDDISKEKRVHDEMQNSEATEGPSSSEVNSDNASQSEALDSSIPQKFQEVVCIDLNTADTTLLQRVPGIGHGRASAIVRYRERLGGFVHSEQLREVNSVVYNATEEQLQDWMINWFTADASTVKKMNVNRAEFNEMLRHPYLEYEQVKALFNLRRKVRKIEGWDALLMLKEFTLSDKEKLLHYIEFK